MRYINALALLLVIVGAVNWLLVGVAKIDLVAALTGNSFGETNALSTVVYGLVGISAIALIPTLVSSFGEHGHRARRVTRDVLKTPPPGTTTFRTLEHPGR